MRLLLDNCVNHRFARVLVGHEVIHARQKGWAELANGNLMRAAEDDGFDVLLTVDKSIRKQMKKTPRKLTLITLDAYSILLEDLLPFLGLIEITLRELQASGKTGEDILITLPKASR